jgi:hypothetical protein
MREGHQSDKIDARRLAELLRLNHLHPVYHGEHGLRSLKELVRSYLTITKDLGRVISRVKAIYRSWAIPCTGKQVYAPRHRAEWLSSAEVGEYTDGITAYDSAVITSAGGRPSMHKFKQGARRVTA